MENLSDIKVIRDILNRHGFTFSKSLGQNFLINPGICPRMAASSGAGPGVGILEIGPGIGVLTAELAKLADKVVSIELDKRLIPVLEETLADFNNTEVINADVLKIDLRRLIEEKFAGLEVCVCANLPYYITSPIIMQLLESRLPIRSITVMVQKEAAQRLCAEIGTRESGAVTAAVRYFAEAQILFQVSRGSFLPPPNVDSSVIRLDIRTEPAVSPKNEAFFFRVVHAAFEQRRKTALNAVSAGMSLPKPTVAQAIRQAGLPETVRGEALSLEDFVKIADYLYEAK